MADESIPNELHAMRIHAMESIRAYGQNVIKGLFLLNGGSAIAVLTLLGSLYARSEQESARLAGLILSNVGTALILFAAGALLSTFMSAIAWINYSFMVRAIGTPWEVRDEAAAQQSLRLRTTSNRWVTITSAAAVIVSILSAGCFVAGGMRFQHALKLATKLPSAF